MMVSCIRGRSASFSGIGLAVAKKILQNVERMLHPRPDLRLARLEFLRDQLDFAFRIDRQSIEIFTVRPHWKDPSRIVEESMAALHAQLCEAGAGETPDTTR